MTLYFDRLKDVFYTAAGKERPAKQQNAATVDTAKVIDLYQPGCGCQRIARLVGCSDSRADQIIQAAKRQSGNLQRSTKRSYHKRPQKNPQLSESAAD